MSDTPEKVCHACGLPKPLTPDHWYRSRGGFDKTCKLCRSKKDGERGNNKSERAEKTQRAIRKTLNRLESQGMQILRHVAENSSPGSKLPHIAEQYEQIMSVFGGTGGFAKQVAATYYSATPGSMVRQRILSDVMRVGAKVSESGMVERDLRHVSDADLERLLDLRDSSRVLTVMGHVEQDAIGPSERAVG